LCAGRVSVGLAVFWYGRGRSLLAQNLVRWQESTLLPGVHPLLQRTMANDFSTMHCNVSQIWLSAANLQEGL